MKNLPGLSLLVILALPITVMSDGLKSKYADEQQRQIKSLSADDISELESGGGWGLAKAAELNGIPGPAHILEMEQEINLTHDQKQKIQQLYDDMNAKAVALGKQLISLEEKLNIGFQKRAVDQHLLEASIEEISQVRAKLRIVHLSTHLRTPDILTVDQIVLYNTLRGYAEDPCENVPDGHDAKMWKLHNGCN